MAVYCVEAIVWRDSVQRGGLLAGAAHPRRQKHREMPPPGASAPALPPLSNLPALSLLQADESSLQQRPLQAKPFSPVSTKIRIGRVPLLRQGQAPLRRLLLRIMPSPWRPVPACVDHDIPQAGHSMLPQSKLESDADLVAATTVADGPIFVAATKIRIGRCILRFWNYNFSKSDFYIKFSFFKS